MYKKRHLPIQLLSFSHYHDSVHDWAIGLWEKVEAAHLLEGLEDSRTRGWNVSERELGYECFRVGRKLKDS